MHRRLPTVLCLVVAVGALAASPALAEGDDPLRRAVDAYLAEPHPGDSVVQGEFNRLLTAAAEERAAPWTFTAALYLWATSIEGDVTAGGNSASIDVPFTELFDDLAGAFMCQFEARKGKWGILANVFWAKIEDSTTAPIGGTTDTEMSLFIGELTGSYRVVHRGEREKGLFTLDAYAGARVYSVEVEITTALAAPEESDTWIDPIVGLDAHYRIHKWNFLARADIGGFEVSSEICWSVTAGVAFECSKRITLAAGYRWLDVTFDSGESVLTHIELAGPYFALVFTW